LEIKIIGKSKKNNGKDKYEENCSFRHDTPTQEKSMTIIRLLQMVSIDIEPGIIECV
jgi:hypothetical protein